MVPGHIITFSLWIALHKIEGIDTHSGTWSIRTLWINFKVMFITTSLDGQASLLETSCIFVLKGVAEKSMAILEIVRK
ncbi:hypothetical protein AAZX31_18G128100 [Glycine max]